MNNGGSLKQKVIERTFDERSLKQITKFAEFRLHFFCTILYNIARKTMKIQIKKRENIGTRVACPFAACRYILSQTYTPKPDTTQ